MTSRTLNEGMRKMDENQPNDTNTKRSGEANYRVFGSRIDRIGEKGVHATQRRYICNDSAATAFLNAHKVNRHLSKIDYANLYQQILG